MFHYSPRKAESLKEVQSALNLPELKIVKLSDTNEKCMRIRKELPALIIALQQFYETLGDAEAYVLV